MRIPPPPSVSSSLNVEPPRAPSRPAYPMLAKAAVLAVGAGLMGACEQQRTTFDAPVLPGLIPIPPSMKG